MKRHNEYELQGCRPFTKFRTNSELIRCIYTTPQQTQTSNISIFKNYWRNPKHNTKENIPNTFP